MPSPEPERAELVERKVCEGYGCGGFFWRPVPKTARDGQKVCPKCQAREDREQRKEGERLRKAQVSRRNVGVDRAKLQRQIERELAGGKWVQ